MAFVLKVSPKGQVTLPKKLRERLKVKDLIEIDVRDDEGIMRQPEQAAREMAGCFNRYAKKSGVTLGKAIEKAKDITAHEIAEKNH